MTRVLIVGDSLAVRELLAHALGSDPEIEIIGYAANGNEAVHKTQQKMPDAILMDLHMSKTNSFDTTRQIMQDCPTPILIVADSAAHGADLRYQAIDAGALAVVARPFASGDAARHAASRLLTRTVKSLAEVKVVRRWRTTGQQHMALSTYAADKIVHQRELVMLGASTGGPAVLREILSELSADYPLPVMIVQHMAAGFVTSFAQWLNTASGFAVVVAEHGMPLSGGRAYLAPDGFHMGVSRERRVALAESVPEHGMRPAVSYLFRSLPQNFCPGAAAVLLTGMGKDGALELRQLKEQGAMTIVQDRLTAAVYGMPGEAIRLDAATLVLNPMEIGKALRAFGLQPPASGPHYSI